MHTEGFTKKSAMWYDLAVRKQPEGQNLSAEVHVPPDSPWFDGHFPGMPILPGIAQLGIVFDLIRQASEKPLRVAGVSRVRFKQLILPDDRLIVSAELRGASGGTYAFRISKGDELVCSGMMEVQSAETAQP